MKLTVKVDGTLVRQGLQDLKAQVPKVGRQGLRVVLERVKRRMQEYPPEPQGQSKTSVHPVLGKTFSPVKGRYVRTGKLGQSWSIEQVDNGYQIGNSATRKGKAYPRFVVGDAYGTGQAWMHKGRWQRFRDVFDQETSRLTDELAAVIRTVTRRYE